MQNCFGHKSDYVLSCKQSLLYGLFVSLPDWRDRTHSRVDKTVGSPFTRLTAPVNRNGLESFDWELCAVNNHICPQQAAKAVFLWVARLTSRDALDLHWYESEGCKTQGSISLAVRNLRVIRSSRNEHSEKKRAQKMFLYQVIK